mmetsp:Transcript_55156/g.109607  ORF Transcript_55156/g.109607 Transcript_55156/m.109607 type:complete len:200 (-) Transcript_55156:1631-2230(-)
MASTHPLQTALTHRTTMQVSQSCPMLPNRPSCLSACRSAALCCRAPRQAAKHALKRATILVRMYRRRLELKECHNMSTFCGSHDKNSANQRAFAWIAPSRTTSRCFSICSRVPWTAVSRQQWKYVSTSRLLSAVLQLQTIPITWRLPRMLSLVNDCRALRLQHVVQPDTQIPSSPSRRKASAKSCRRTVRTAKCRAKKS